MIKEVDNALQVIVDTEIGEGQFVIKFDAPTREKVAEWGGAHAVDLFLYEIHEDRAKRSCGRISVYQKNGEAPTLENLGPEYKIGEYEAPRFFALTYMLTVWTGTPMDEHQVLGQLTARFAHEQTLLLPSLESIPILKLLGVTASLEISELPQDRIFTDLWPAIGNTHTPFVSLTVTLPLVWFDAPAIEYRVDKVTVRFPDEVPNAAPSITEPPAGNTGRRPQIKGTCVAGATVTVATTNGTITPATVTPGGTATTWTLPNLTDDLAIGRHELTATQTVPGSAPSPASTPLTITVVATPARLVVWGEGADQLTTGAPTEQGFTQVACAGAGGVNYPLVAVAIDKDGKLRVWGQNAAQLSEAPTEEGFTQVACTGYGRAGTLVAVAIDKDGKLRVWGQNAAQLSEAPTEEGFTQVACTGYGVVNYPLVAVAIDKDGKLRVWGQNAAQLSEAPTEEGFTQVACTGLGGADSPLVAVAIDKDGKLRVWGQNAAQLSEAPTEEGFTQVACTGSGRADSPLVAVAIDKDGKLRVWGQNAAQLSEAPTEEGFTQVACTGSGRADSPLVAVAIDKDGKLRVWGQNAAQLPEAPTEEGFTQVACTGSGGADSPLVAVAL
ncbi:Pvc16 family protein [Streptomyces sp. WZ-12]|uniref:Pvc16 family protein n=1 Tax=Streptomyces sp. WZ-12 TaxID=3030210 RepID=UPI0023815192|nr:Pvc16 family protein [Streptomyces sp. WZ-12]